MLRLFVTGLKGGNLFLNNKSNMLILKMHQTFWLFNPHASLLFLNWATHFFLGPHCYTKNSKPEKKMHKFQGY